MTASTTLLAGSLQPLALPQNEIELARASGNLLSQMVGGDSALEPVLLHFKHSKTGETIEVAVPALAMGALGELLTTMASGQSVSLIPSDSELSTQKAAELMGVSRPYFIKILEAGAMPFRKVGEQRRVRYSDLVRYLEEYRKTANSALDEMTAEAEKLGLYE